MHSITAATPQTLVSVTTIAPGTAPIHILRPVFSEFYHKFILDFSRPYKELLQKIPQNMLFLTYISIPPFHRTRYSARALSVSCLVVTLCFAFA